MHNRGISRSFVLDNLNIPRQILRSRSFSNASLSPSRSPSPAPSIAPSTPSLASIPTNPSFELPNRNADLSLLIRATQVFWPVLDMVDVLALTSTTRQFQPIRSGDCFWNYMEDRGWDTGALERRFKVSSKKEQKKGAWLHVARTCVHRDGILKEWSELPKTEIAKEFVDKGGKSYDYVATHPDKLKKSEKKAAEKLLRILVDCVTEHDEKNIPKLVSLAESQGKTFVEFVCNIPASDWKGRYRQSFIAAVVLNAMPDLFDVDDIGRVSATISPFFEQAPSQTLLLTQANFLYMYHRSEGPEIPYAKLTSMDYDPPHLQTADKWSLPGTQQAVDKFGFRVRCAGTYRRKGGEMTKMELDIEPKGLANSNRLSIPFISEQRPHITMTAWCRDESKEKPWDMEGSVDPETGVGELRTLASGMPYDLWVTPWAVVGQKSRMADGKQLGFFVLHWPSREERAA